MNSEKNRKPFTEKLTEGIRSAVEEAIFEHFRDGRKIVVSENGKVIEIDEKGYWERVENKTEEKKPK